MGWVVRGVVGIGRMVVGAGKEALIPDESPRPADSIGVNVLTRGRQPQKRDRNKCQPESV